MSNDHELLAQASNPTDIVAGGQTLQRTGTQYTTAVAVQRPRDLQQKARQLEAESRLAGEEFFYGWGAGKDRIIGPSIGLATAAARIWGNCVVQAEDIQDLPDAWVFTASFVDLETGFTMSRQFRQSKNWTVYGKFDQERKDDIRFQIGASKAARNVILNALPKWLVRGAMRAAQEGVRERVEQFIEKKGLAAAVDMVVVGLKKHGVTEEAILSKCSVAELRALDVEDVLMLRGDLYTLDEGQDRVEEVFPQLGRERRKAATSMLEQTLGAEPAPEPEPEPEPAPEPDEVLHDTDEGAVPDQHEGGETRQQQLALIVGALLDEIQRATTLKALTALEQQLPADANDEQVAAISEAAEQQRDHIRSRRSS